MDQFFALTGIFIMFLGVLRFIMGGHFSHLIYPHCYGFIGAFSFLAFAGVHPQLQLRVGLLVIFTFYSQFLLTRKILGQLHTKGYTLKLEDYNYFRG